MAIITQTILSTDEYLEVYPQDANVETDIIAGSINDATITLDAICGGMIAKVWPVIDPTDPLFRTEEEKNYIKQAHAIQAHEGVCRSVDFTGGSESYTSGSNNYNQSRTTPGIVADEIIYQLLAKARVYNPNITTDTTIASNQGDFYDPTYDPSQEYITIELGDNRYVHKHAEDLGSANKFLYYDENGNITYVDLGEIIVENIYTKEEVDELFTHYYTKVEVDTVFQTKADPNLITPTKEIVAGINEAWDRAVGVQYNYAISLQDPANLAFVSTNDTITATSIKDLEGRTINATDMVIGASVYNTDPAVPDRWLGAIDETTGQGTFYRLSEKIDLSGYATKEYVNTTFATIESVALKQNITDNNLTTTAKTIVGAINEVNAKPIPEEHHLYQHTIMWNKNDNQGMCIIYNTISTRITTYAQFLSAIGDTTKPQAIPIWQAIGQQIYKAFGVGSNGSGGLMVAYINGTSQAYLDITNCNIDSSSVVQIF